MRLLHKKILSFDHCSVANASQSSNSGNPIHSFVTGEVEVKRHVHEPSRFRFYMEFYGENTFECLAHEAFRQINISIRDSTNLYDGLEAFWLRTLNEEPSDPQVYCILKIMILSNSLFR